MTLTRRQVATLLDAHGLAPSRALGQNFLVDPNTVRRIARIAEVGPGDRVVEIGAGVGCLTLALAETGASVTAVELDRGLLGVLDEVLAGTEVRVVAGDARTLDWHDLLGDGDARAAGGPSEAGGDDRPWTLVANLPYNIATPLVCDLLESVPRIERMVVMVQREVADRFVAHAGSRTYGIPSVKIAFRARARIVATVGPDVFLPRPRVDSAVVEIVRRPGGTAAPDVGVTDLWQLVETAFGQRRKMLRRSLGNLVDPAVFDEAGVDPAARPEQLDLDAWLALVRAWRR